MVQCCVSGGRETWLGPEPGLRRRRDAPDVGLQQIPQYQLEEMGTEAQYINCSLVLNTGTELFL